MVIIKMGHFYRRIGPNGGSVHRANLCTFCNGRKVASYFWKCVNRERGSILIADRQLGDCSHAVEFIEITEQEYIQSKVEQMIKEGL